MAPDGELSTAMIACVASTLLFQPAMVPSSVANNSVLGPKLLPDLMPKPAVALVATPVGADVPPPGAGIVTAMGEPAGIGWPAPSNVSAMPLPFSAIHNPLFVPTAMPQGFTRFGSVRAAI